MIRLTGWQQAAVDELLSGAVVESQLRAESWLGDTKLADLAVQGGTVSWDAGSDLLGLLDVDVEVGDRTVLGDPVAGFGQVLRVWWRWPQIGVEVPVGWWRIDKPARRDRVVWTVRADPLGPSMLRRSLWLTPPSTTIVGTVAQQIESMVRNAGASWVPGSTWSDAPLGDTVCEVGETTLEAVQRVLVQSGAVMAPSRQSAAVVVSRPSEGLPEWELVGGTCDSTVDSDKSVNAVVAYFEVPGTGGVDPTYVASPVMRLMAGPRRWDGPEGRAPKVLKLDAPVSMDALQAIALSELYRAQTASATIKVSDVRADPRREVGDIFRVVSQPDEIDAVCRCTAIELDVSTGLSTVSGAVMSGTVNGIHATYTP